jgi:hypothetical protein
LLALRHGIGQQEVRVRRQDHVGAAASEPAAVQQLVQQWTSQPGVFSEKGEGVAARMEHAVTGIAGLESLAALFERKKIKIVIANDALEVRMRGDAHLMSACP